MLTVQIEESGFDQVVAEIVKNVSIRFHGRRYRSSEILPIDGSNDGECLFIAAENDPAAYLALADWFEENRAEYGQLQFVTLTCRRLAEGKAPAFHRDTIGRHLARELKFYDDFDRTFRMGEVVEYDSYNLSYHGTIAGIGAATVTIQKGRRESKSRLKLGQFLWRNWSFDLDKSCEENGRTMQYI